MNLIFWDKSHAKKLLDYSIKPKKALSKPSSMDTENAKDCGGKKKQLIAKIQIKAYIDQNFTLSFDYEHEELNISNFTGNFPGILIFD